MKEILKLRILDPHLVSVSMFVMSKEQHIFWHNVIKSVMTHEMWSNVTELESGMM